MAGMGLGAAYGAGGAGDAIQEIMKNRLLTAQFNQQQQDIEEHKREAMVRVAQSQQTIDQQQHYQQMIEQDRRDRLDADKASRDAGAKAKEFEDSLKLGDTIPGGTFVPNESPVAGRLRLVGLAQDQQERPAVDTGPLQPGDTGMARMAGVLKLASAKQQKDAQDLDTKQQIADIRQQIADAGRGGPTPHFTPQTTFDETGRPTGAVSFNTLTGAAQPLVLPNGGALKPPPGAAQNAQTADRKKTGLDAVSRVEQDIDKADSMGLIGPAAGRFYSLMASAGTTGDPAKDDMIGRLKADLLLTKMHVDSGIGGARAAASPLLLKNWEDLALKSSKDLLHGYTSALRSDLSGGGQSTGGGKPTAEDLIRKYGG